MRMTPKQIADTVARLDAISAANPEGAHAEADAVLLEVVPAEVSDAYERLVERCAWWKTA